MTKDLARFATEDCPLHPSGLRALLICPWKVVMRYLAVREEEEEHGVAGDTGSAVHVAAAEMHRGKGPAECLQAMGARQREYPQADLQDAAGLFLAYSRDPRNSRAVVVAVEEPVKFSIQAAPEDPTGSPIEVIGTLDQVREDHLGRLELWDLKTSKKDPMALLRNHTFQIAAYCVGATIKLGRPVRPGGVILPRKYKDMNGNGPVFWKFPWKFEDLEQILSAVRHRVAQIRSGVFWHVPTDDCEWCQARSPDLCLPKLQETLSLMRAVK